MLHASISAPIMLDPDSSEELNKVKCSEMYSGPLIFWGEGPNEVKFVCLIVFSGSDGDPRLPLLVLIGAIRSPRPPIRFEFFFLCGLSFLFGGVHTNWDHSHLELHASNAITECMHIVVKLV